jgi:peptidyl-prolyl cis-trans isomerase A (cyclophilin A)
VVPSILALTFRIAPETPLTRRTVGTWQTVDMSIHTAVATIHTNKGDIVVNLFGNHAPKTVGNFVGLATGTQEWTHPGTGAAMTSPLYDGVIFHRIITDFMLQAGDPLGRGTGGPGYEFNDEIHPELQFSEPFLFAMANAGTRGGKGTNGSQFFITTVATPWLNGKHTIFGAVVDDDSKAVVKAIEAVPTNANDKPVDDVVITSIEVVEVA